MNKKIFLFLFLIPLLFGSCALQDQTAFGKRKYMPGVFVNNTSAHKQEKGSGTPAEQISLSDNKTSEPIQHAVRVVETQAGVVKQKAKALKIVDGVVSKQIISDDKSLALKQKLELKLEQHSVLLSEKKKGSRKMEGVDGEMLLIALFVLLLTTLYMAQILAEAPDMPIGLAFLLALLCTAVTMLTGQVIWF